MKTPSIWLPSSITIAVFGLFLIAVGFLVNTIIAQAGNIMIISGLTIFLIGVAAQVVYPK